MEVRSHDVVSTLRTTLRTLREFSPSFSLSLSSLPPAVRPSSSLSGPLLHAPGRATYRADPLFLRATRVCYTMPLQVENTDRLGINRSRDTEPTAGKEEGNVARVTRAARESVRAAEGDGRKIEREG